MWTAIVLSLSLGTGANIALFSLVNGLMLRPLPVPDPDRLVSVVTSPGDVWSYQAWEELRGSAGLFRSAAAWASQTFNTTPRGRASLVNGLFVSGEFFSTLGIVPARGRLIVPDDDRRDSGTAGLVAVISHGFWQHHFTGAEDVIGRTILIDRVSFTIVGVTPRGFLGPEIGTAFDVAVPLGSEPRLRAVSLVNMPTAWWLNVFARLEPGRTIDETAARLRAFQSILRDRVGSATDPRGARLNAPFDLQPAGRGISTLRARYERPLTVLIVVAALVLAIACANIANLLFVRAIARRREMSVRLALGASTSTLMKQLMAESAVLAGVGSLGGALLARWGSAVLVTQLSPASQGSSLNLSPDWRVFAFAIGVAVFTLFASSLLPAIRAGQVDAAEAVKPHGQRVLGASRYRGAHALLVVQVAFSLMLLVAAGLFARTLSRLLTQPLGVERQKVLVIRVEMASPPAEPERVLALYDRFLDAARAAQGVERAGLSAMTPIGGNRWQILFEVPGTSLPLGEDARTITANVVSPEFFATFGTRVLFGREFLPSDDRRSVPVTIVNQAFVRAYLGGEAPLRRRVRQVGFGGRPSVDREIVGVVEDAVYLSLRQMNQPTMYIPLAQRPQAPAVIYVSIRASGAPSELAHAAIDALSTVNADATFSAATLAEHVDHSIAQERLVAALSGFFGALALLLAGLGLYGVTSHTVSQRRAELGIRLALGAPAGRVVGLVLGRLAVLVAVGIAIGAGVSFLVSPVVATLLYGLSPRDPLTFTGAAAVVAAVGGLAGFLPARQAARLDPADVLRQE